MEGNTKAFLIDQIMPKMEKFCAYQERCRFDVHQKLQRLGIERDKWAEIIGMLESENFLNEERFVELFIRSKVRLKAWGPIKVRMELQRRGIPKDLIEQFSALMQPDEQKDVLLHLLEKKRKSLKDEDAFKQKEKLVRFGISKGYEMGQVFATVARLLKMPDLE